jgi:2',3'-cyclic-nucleotide 2'-phosphodiesterase/3'-nucleotidase
MDTRKINIIFTSDIHGNYFPYDFRRDRWGKGSLQRVHAFVAQQVKRLAGATILIDGGDMIQGEPTSYYFNQISDAPRHKVADICNFIGYDVGVIGNHDIETGAPVYEKFINSCNFPILGANAIDDVTGEPRFTPYTIIRRAGIRIAVIGFITPAIPYWITRRVWQGMHFEDIRTSAQYWIDEVKRREQPDFIIGLFHSGMEDGIITEEYRENAVRDTVSHVDGFDLVLYGHDHASNMEEVESPSGKNIICVNPGSYAYSVAEIRLKFHVQTDDSGNVTRVVKCDQSAQLCYIGTISNSHANEFKRHFRHEFEEVKNYASQKLGRFDAGVDITEAYFGSSAYIDFIQMLQLNISKADISFAAPLFFNASIEPGEVCISNIFNLYRFEDRLYTVRLTGSEIKAYLEMSYANWTMQMRNENDQLLMLSPMKSNPKRMGFTNFIFNFDSAAGIRYEVDVSKPQGQKLNIISMEDGSPFLPDRFYTVAMTAYRANGGGELLTKGAGLSKEEIEARITGFTERDIRYYMTQYIQQHGHVRPAAHGHWRFIPSEWVEKAEKRERKLLFDTPPQQLFNSNSSSDETETDGHKFRDQ